MPELAGSIGDRGKALQHQEQVWERTRSYRQIEKKFSWLVARVKAIGRLGIDKTLHAEDVDAASGKATQFEGRRAPHLERSERIGERGARRPHPSLKGNDAVLILKYPDFCGGRTFTDPVVGLARRGIANAVIGRRNNQGKPIFDIC